MRGSILIIILVLGIGLLATVLLLGNHGLEWSIIREGIHHVLPLTEEVQPEITVMQQTITIQPGQVYRITNTEYGPTLTTTGSRLIETLDMTNITLQGGDVISWHGWDVVVRDVDNYAIVFDDVGIDVTGSITLRSEGWIGINLFPDAVKYPKLVSMYARPFYPIGNVFFDIAVDNDNGWFGSAYIKMVNVTSNDVSIMGITSLTIDDTSINKYRMLASFSSIGNTLYKYSYLVWGDKETEFEGTDDTTGYYTTLNYPSDNPLGYSSTSTSVKLYNTLDYWTIKSMYLIVQNNYVNKWQDTHIIYKTVFMFDPTWYNGTHFIALDGTLGNPYSNLQRVPAEQTWLWLIKSVESDGYLHLKYVPAGATFRIIVNGVTYEWHIPEDDANAVGLIEDYPIDITALFGQTFIDNATIELIYPSDRVRIYAPSGFTVKLSGSFTVEKAVGDEGYVDVGVPEGSYTLELLATQQTEPVVNIDVIGSSATIIVTDQNNVAIPDAQVVVSDGDNIVAQGITDDLGKYTFTLPDDANSLSISVIGLKDGVYYTGVETVQLVEPGGGAQLPTESLSAENLPSNNSSSAIAVVLLLLAVIMIAIAVGGRGK